MNSSPTPPAGHKGLFCAQDKEWPRSGKPKGIILEGKIYKVMNMAIHLNLHVSK